MSQSIARLPSSENRQIPLLRDEGPTSCPEDAAVRAASEGLEDPEETPQIFFRHPGVTRGRLCMSLGLDDPRPRIWID